MAENTVIDGELLALLLPGDKEKIASWLAQGASAADPVFGLDPVEQSLLTAHIAAQEIGLRRDGIVAILLQPVATEDMDLGAIEAAFGPQVARIMHGLGRTAELYEKSPVAESENFRALLLSFAEDMRVVLIMIARRVCLMRQLRDAADEAERRRVAQEAAYLYAPLAHKLGLYKLKSELEDLSLKYLEHDAYYHIKDKLGATKAARDKYIESFICPVAEKLTAAGLHFHIKGRTKSIHSIWQKMKKQHCEFEGVYDLFAIRIIIDSPEDKEKMQCWQAYSIVTDMYQPNPKRLRDWLSVPKSNGYESLHITVLGPDRKWVEVQIRTERMDAIAERGVAAHWRYKGVKAETGIDDWLAGIRGILEAGDGREVMDQFKMDLYEDEVFVFTPKGDLLKFPKGATVLDFAYHIHSKVGNSCTGARIGGKIVSIREALRSGDQVEIITSATQKPKQEWLTIVQTSRAKAKIRLALKETQVKEGLMVKEMIERKFRNRKIELEESLMSKLIKKLGFKETRDFYHQTAEGQIDINTIVNGYLEVQAHEQGKDAEGPVRSAGEYSFQADGEAAAAGDDDTLVIDAGLKGIDWQPARCCSPIYGDSIFGFVTVSGGIKIHRTDCPNAPALRSRFGYRIVKAKWSGKGSTSYAITLRVVGNDDLGIVNNLTSIISKEERITMRGISIDSHDGLFSGNITVNIEDLSRLQALIKKLRTVKGVKQVERA